MKKHSNPNIVYGVVINQEQFLRLFGPVLREIRNRLPEDEDDESDVDEEGADGFGQQLCKVMDLADEDTALEIYYDFLRTSVVFNYACCSELAEKKWVVGQQLGNLDPMEILNKTICLEELAAAASSVDWNKFLIEHNLTGLSHPRKYLLLDDCTYCS